MITRKDIQNNHADNPAAMLHFVPAPQSGRGISVTVRLHTGAQNGAVRDYRIYEAGNGYMYIQRAGIRESLTIEAEAIVRAFRSRETRLSHSLGGRAAGLEREAREAAAASPELPASSVKLPYTLDIASTVETYRDAHAAYHDLPDAEQEGQNYEDYEDALLSVVHDLADYAETASGILARIVATYSTLGVHSKHATVRRILIEAGLLDPDASPGD